MPYTNPLDKAKWQREWRAAHREKIRSWSRATHRRNRWYKRSDTANRKWGQKVHWSVMARIGMLPCFSCGVEPADGVDHIVCKKHGGTHTVDNMQPACLSCNRRKQSTCKEAK
jgi:hypothetical protein